MNQIVYAEATRVDQFASFTEKVPKSTIPFNLIAIPGGKFKIGSPEVELYRRPDEGPLKEISALTSCMTTVCIYTVCAARLAGQQLS